jgi:phytanoyl-CoA hydroxylase
VVRAVVPLDVVERSITHLETVPGDALRTGPIDDFFAEVIELLTPLAGDVLASDVEAFGATYVVKPAFDGLPTRWHQDGHPWEQRGITSAVSIGIALDPSTRANGCLLVIPGSHRLDAQPLRPVADPPNVFGAEIDPALVDESLAVAVELEPGDASIHHPNLIHGAEPNTSATPRRTLVLRYQAA